jgi:hypothetical protein
VRFAVKTSLLFCTILLGGCQSGAPLSTLFDNSATATATDPVVYIGVTPAVLTWTQDRLDAFAGLKGEEVSRIRLLPLPASQGIPALDEAEIQMLITGVRPSGDRFLTPLGYEGIAIVLHPDNPIRSCTMELLRGLFSGSISDWETLSWEGQVTPLLPLPGDDLRSVFQQTVMEDLRFSSGGLIGPTPNAISQLLEDDPMAIGLMPFSDVTESVRIAGVESILPNEASIHSQRYPLSLPVFGVAIEEPRGIVREWISWLQADL